MREGNVVAARAALASAKEAGARLPEREASHVAFFELVFGGQTDAAIAVLHEHLAAWPQDALVVASAANPNGVIGGSGVYDLPGSMGPFSTHSFWLIDKNGVIRFHQVSLEMHVPFDQVERAVSDASR